MLVLPSQGPGRNFQCGRLSQSPLSAHSLTMKYLVVDSGPLIKGARLERMGAERFVTVPEVLGSMI